MPDKFTNHEALHTTYIIQGMFGQHVLTNDLVKESKQIWVLAEKIEADLAALYQEIGKVE